MKVDLRRFRGGPLGSPWFNLYGTLLMLVVSVPMCAFAQVERQQTLGLDAGWNAVYLDIDPFDADPVTLFAGTPVDVVATYAVPSRGAQFVGDPTADMRGAYGWAVWYAPHRPDAFLSTLYGIYGAKPYLIHATTNTTLTLAGAVAPESVVWTPDAYNFVGFPVQNPGAPTFAQFFSGSRAHNHNKIYRMVDGTWRQVLDPTATVMRAGEAFWIFCDGRSDYTGPLHVTAPSDFGVRLTEDTGAELVFRNRTGHPVSFVLSFTVSPQAPIPISIPVQGLSDTEGEATLSVHLEAGSWEQPFPPLEAGRALRLPMFLRSREMDAGTREGLLTVTSDLGTVSYIPLRATREDAP